MSSQAMKRSRVSTSYCSQKTEFGGPTPVSKLTKVEIQGQFEILKAYRALEKAFHAGHGWQPDFLMPMFSNGVPGLMQERYDALCMATKLKEEVAKKAETTKKVRITESTDSSDSNSKKRPGRFPDIEFPILKTIRAWESPKSVVDIKAAEEDLAETEGIAEGRIPPYKLEEKLPGLIAPYTQECCDACDEMSEPDIC